MPKYLMFKHHRGPRAPEITPEQWSPEDWRAHMTYMEDFAERLRGSGEFVTSVALSDEGSGCITAPRDNRPRSIARSRIPKISSPG